MITKFRPWHTENDQKKLIAWAKLQAHGHEITKVEIIKNIYGDDFIRVQFKTATEKQSIHGFYDLCTRSKALWKLPKKYQPDII